jgi:hypothetical protein
MGEEARELESRLRAREQAVAGSDEEARRTLEGARLEAEATLEGARVRALAETKAARREAGDSASAPSPRRIPRPKRSWQAPLARPRGSWTPPAGEATDEAARLRAEAEQQLRVYEDPRRREADRLVEAARHGRFGGR